MPTRNGTGPQGQGSRTGRGMGNCKPTATTTNKSTNTGLNQPFGWGGRMWSATFGLLFRRNRANRGNRM